MKKLMLPLFAVLLFAACQNTPAAPAETGTPAAPTTPTGEVKPLTQVDVLQASAKAKTTVEDLNSIIADLNALPAEAKTNYKDHVELLQKLAADLLAKQQTIAKGLETAAANGNSIPNEAEIRALISATEENARHMDGFRSRVEQVRNRAMEPKK